VERSVEENISKAYIKVDRKDSSSHTRDIEEKKTGSDELGKGLEQQTHGP
jgi:hypothetical protein